VIQGDLKFFARAAASVPDSLAREAEPRATARTTLQIVDGALTTSETANVQWNNLPRCLLPQLKYTSPVREASIARRFSTSSTFQTFSRHTCRERPLLSERARPSDAEAWRRW
jgi:hypothetical protein